MAGDIRVNVLTGFNDKGVKDAIASLRGVGSGISSVTKQLLGGFGAWQAYNGGISLIRNSLDATRDLERNMAGLKTIFGDTTAEMQAFAKAGVAYGQSTAEAAKNATFLGSVLKQSGFTMEQTSKFTKDLVVLGADLAATYGYDVQEALTGMTAMFRGEYDPIEKFGVAIKQAQVNAEMARLGLSKLTGQEKLHAQQLVRMKMLFEATGDAQGAFKRNGDTLFVSQQRLAATFTNLQAALGQSLLAPMTQLVQLMSGLTTVVGPAMTKLFEAIGKYFTIGGDSATAFAAQIVGLIDQITNIVSSVQWIVEVIVWVFKNFGASIVSAIIAFKLFSGIVTKVGTVVTAFNTIMAFFAARQAAAAAATTALAAAETAAIAPTVALGAASLATPWGAIALAIGLVAAAVVGIAVVTANAEKPTGELAKTVNVMGTNMADANGKMAGYNQNLSSISNNMMMVSSSAVKAATAVAGATNVFAKTGDYFNVRREISGAGYKPKEDPVKAIDKQLKDMMNNLSGSLDKNSSKLKNSAKKTAKAAADPFKEMVDRIQSEMKRLHNSLMGAFDITNFGRGKATISQNMGRFMSRMREFAGLIGKLKNKGLSPELLTQLVNAGPEGGLDAARALNSSAALRKESNAAYSEMGKLATSIASNTVKAQAQNIYNIEVKGGLQTGATIGEAVVKAIKSYERQSGPSWRTA